MTIGELREQLDQITLDRLAPVEVSGVVSGASLKDGRPISVEVSRAQTVRLERVGASVVIRIER